MTRWTAEDAEYRRYQNGKYDGVKGSIELTLESVKDLPLYTPEEESRVFKEYRKNPTKELRDEIIMHNLKLVSSVALAYKGIKKLSPEDLFQEGVFGLMRAIDKFDPDMGYRFSTYAVWWIRQAIGRYVDDAERTIRVPAHAMELYKKVKRMQNERAIANLPPYTNDELKEILGKTDKDFESITAIQCSESVSYESIISEDHGEATELGDFIEDPNTEAAFLDAERGSLADYFEECLQTYLLYQVPPAQRDRTEDILRRRLGLNDKGTIEILEEIGKDYGITRERVRQIEAKFMKYLRRPDNKRVLREFL